MPGPPLILGGTAEARALSHLVADLDPVVSLAGVTGRPAAYAGRVRSGGFGGAEGLARYLAAEGIAALVDATHPFAARMQANAATAARAAGVPLLRLARPGWAWAPDWRAVPDAATAIAALPPGAVALVALGRSAATSLAPPAGVRLILRMIEPPAAPLPDGVGLILSPPLASQAEEAALLRENGVTHLLAKDSGGTASRAKLEAAAALGVRVLMIPRPPPVPGVATAATPEAAAAWARARTEAAARRA